MIIGEARSLIRQRGAIELMADDLLRDSQDYQPASAARCRRDAASADVIAVPTATLTAIQWLPLAPSSRSTHRTKSGRGYRWAAHQAP